MKEIFSSGGGTQSACIAALIVQGRLPKPDLAVIVDTERERPAVWQYHDTVIVPQLREVGVTIHRVSKSSFTRTDIWSENGDHLLIPAFTDKGGSHGKLSSFCSDKWKKRVSNRFLRSLGIPTTEQRMWIGFSLDEANRYTRMKLGVDGERCRFPLIEDVPLRRQQAICEVEKIGWPTPPRSACWMCPNQGDHEWRDLKLNWPREFEMAVELERDVQKKDPNAFLHRSRVPLDQVDFAQDDDLFSHPCNSGMCFV